MINLRSIVLIVVIPIAFAVGCGHRGLTKVVKTDGTIVVGTLVEARPDRVLIKAPTGETITIARPDIASMEAVQQSPSGPAAAEPLRGGPTAQVSDTPGTGPPSSPEGEAAGRSGEPGSPAGGSGTPVASSSGTPSDRVPESAGNSLVPDVRRGSEGTGAGTNRTLAGPTVGDPRNPTPSHSDARAGGPANVSRPPSPNGQFVAVTVPAGTQLSVALKTAVGSSESHPEDRVQATLTRPLVVRGIEALPVGTEVDGVVIEAVPSQRIRGRAYVVVRFDRVKTAAGDLPIRSAVVRREAASTVGRDAKRTGFGAAIGGAIGGVVGRSKAALGIGAAAGAGAVAAHGTLTRGAEIQLAPGTPLVVRITEPLSVSAAQR